MSRATTEKYVIYVTHLPAFLETLAMRCVVARSLEDIFATGARRTLLSCLVMPICWRSTSSSWLRDKTGGFGIGCSWFTGAGAGAL